MSTDEDTQLRRAVRASLEAGRSVSEQLQGSRKLVEPIAQQATQAKTSAFETLFKYRRTHPWEIVGLASLGALVASFPGGRRVMLRNAALTGVATTAVVNPEYISQLVKDRHNYYP